MFFLANRNQLSIKLAFVYSLFSFILILIRHIHMVILLKKLSIKTFYQFQWIPPLSLWLCFSISDCIQCQTNKQTYKQTNKQTYKQTNKQTYKQTNKPNNSLLYHLTKTLPILIVAFQWTEKGLFHLHLKLILKFCNH